MPTAIKRVTGAFGQIYTISICTIDETIVYVAVRATVEDNTCPAMFCLHIYKFKSITHLSEKTALVNI
jgi:hypothetical protein